MTVTRPFGVFGSKGHNFLSLSNKDSIVRNYHRITRLLLIASLALLLFACGGGGNDSPAEKPEVTSMNVNYVAHDGGTGGVFQKSGDFWLEKDSNNETLYVFTETERNETSVMLYDESRDIYLELDISQNIISFHFGTDDWQELYVITDTSVVMLLTGFNVNRVEHNGGTGGVYQNTGDRWLEKNSENETVFEFSEIDRGEVSVVLYDASRDIWLEIDLLQNVIYFHFGTDAWQELYSIVDASDALLPMTGMNVNRVEHNDGTGGVFQNTGDLWVEKNSFGATTFRFTETGRDEWSVYLYDPSRDMSIALDLWQDKVQFHYGTDPWADLYPITGTSDILLTINGINVHHVEHDGGLFRDTGDALWLEYNNEGTQIYSFAETGRDEWSVYLYNSSRDESLQLDLNLETVFFHVGADPWSELYTITSVSD